MSIMATKRFSAGNPAIQPDYSRRPVPLVSAADHARTLATLAANEAEDARTGGGVTTPRPIMVAPPTASVAVPLKTSAQASATTKPNSQAPVSAVPLTSAQRSIQDQFDRFGYAGSRYDQDFDRNQEIARQTMARGPQAPVAVPMKAASPAMTPDQQAFTKAAVTGNVSGIMPMLRAGASPRPTNANTAIGKPGWSNAPATADQPVAGAAPPAATAPPAITTPVTLPPVTPALVAPPSAAAPPVVAQPATATDQIAATMKPVTNAPYAATHPYTGPGFGSASGGVPSPGGGIPDFVTPLKAGYNAIKGSLGASTANPDSPSTDRLAPKLTSAPVAPPAPPVPMIQGIDRAAVTDDDGNLPARALGGPVTAGQPTLVGEQGPEVVVPQQNGMVIPNQPPGAAPAGFNPQQTVKPKMPPLSALWTKKPAAKPAHATHFQHSFFRKGKAA